MSAQGRAGGGLILVEHFAELSARPGPSFRIRYFEQRPNCTHYYMMQQAVRGTAGASGKKRPGLSVRRYSLGPMVEMIMID